MLYERNKMYIKYTIHERIIYTSYIHNTQYKSKSDKSNTKLNEISIKLVKENNCTKDEN